MKITFIALCIVATLFYSADAFSQAKLIAYRPGCIYGSLAKYKVNINNKEVAVLKSNSIYATDITPGKNTIAPKQLKRAVTIDAKTGETYVIKYKTPLHIFGARPRLEVLTLAEAEKSKKFRKLQSKSMKM